MPNDHFEFKQFTIWQSACSQKVSTDASIFGAWTALHARPIAHILDIGAGTGLLMLMLAQKHDAGIDGIEIDPDCFDQMTENISKCKWSDRLKAFAGDVKEMDTRRNYDLVLSNPPFYENQLSSPDERKNLAWHSSRLSLDDLFSTASGLLDTHGEFALIVPYGRKDELPALANNAAFHLKRTLSVRHTLKHPFTRYIAMYSKQDLACVDEQLDIKTEEANYSEGMLELMKDYYLFL